MSPGDLAVRLSTGYDGSLAGTGSAQTPPRDFQQLRRADGAFVGAVAPGWLGAPYSPAAAVQSRQRAMGESDEDLDLSGRVRGGDEFEPEPEPEVDEQEQEACVGSKLYAVGGAEGDDSSDLNSAEVYDPASDSWFPISPMGSKRSGLGLASVGSKLYAVGGAEGVGSYLNSAEVYDPSSFVPDLRCSPPYGRRSQATSTRLI
eukprot:COSAG05_NODE_127_length_17241_cov_7.514817_14_plen_203_part_00